MTSTKPAIDSELTRTTIGYENLKEELDSISRACPKGYPPTNISIIHKDVGSAGETGKFYEITMAVAGFTMADIDIVQKNNILSISGHTNVLDDDLQREVLYKGIAERNFSRQYRVVSTCEVRKATLKDGMLTILIAELIPEEETTIIKINAEDR